jgi:hypothetical protein
MVDKNVGNEDENEVENEVDVNEFFYLLILMDRWID